MFDILKKSFLPDKHKNMGYLCFGGLSGALATTFVYPFDLVKTLLAVQPECKGILNSMVGVVRDSGIRGLFRGLSATLIGMTPYASLKLTFFQVVRSSLSESLNGISSDVSNMVYGGLAGCMALTITYPTDVVRRRL